MGDAAVDVEQDVGRAAADVDDRDADLLLVVGEDGLGARERLEHDVGDDEAAALGAADDVLHAARGGGDEVHLRAEAHAAHPDRVADAVLDVDDVLARQDVEDLAVGVDRDGARAFEDALDVGARHLAAGDGRDAVGRLRADVAAGDAGVDGADLDAGHRLRRLDGVLDRARRSSRCCETMPLRSPRQGTVADAEDRDPVLGDLADDGAHLRGADVEADDDFGFVFHIAASIYARSDFGQENSSKCRADADAAERRHDVPARVLHDHALRRKEVRDERDERTGGLSDRIGHENHRPRGAEPLYGGHRRRDGRAGDRQIQEIVRVIGAPVAHELGDPRAHTLMM